MKVRVRDLFWLMLLAITLTVWGIGHHRKAAEIARNRMDHWFLKIDDGKPTDAELKRRIALKELSRLTDDELDARLAANVVGHHSSGEAEYEPCLAEMARRGLADRLQKHYDTLMAQGRNQSAYPRFPPNLELLTALRRAQRQPDPLILELAINSRPPWAADYPGPCLHAIVQNADVGKESVLFFDGGDDRGGRRERWRFVLTDAQGHQVADSNYAPMMGGGLCSVGPLEYGKTGNRYNFFELRKYICPPASGKYQLQALYHNRISIADERDASGLIVSKSEPVAVIVDNPTPAVAEERRLEGRESLTILVACAVLMAMSVISIARTQDTSAKPNQTLRFGRVLGISRRDLCWSALIGVLATVMWLDQRRQAAMTVNVRSHAAASWSIRLANEGEL